MRSVSTQLQTWYETYQTRKQQWYQFLCQQYKETGFHVDKGKHADWHCKSQKRRWKDDGGN